MFSNLFYISLPLFFFYWFFALKLVDIIMPRVAIKGFSKLAFTIVATIFSYQVFFGMNLHIFQSYLGLFIIYSILYGLIYQSSFLLTLLCSSACIMHIVAFHAISSGIYTFFVDGSFSFTTISAFGRHLILWMAFAIVTSCLILLVYAIPRKYLNIKFLSKKHIFTLTVLALLFTIFLTYNLYVFIYLLPIDNAYISTTEIITPIIFLSIYYLVLFTNVLSSNKAKYQKMIDKLSSKVEDDLIMRDIMLNDGLLAYEVICETGKMREIFNKTKTHIDPSVYYNDYIPIIARDLIHPDDMHTFLSHFSLNYLSSIYKQGKRDFAIDYRRVAQDGYRWATAQTTLWFDEETNETKALVYVRDIDSVKSQQIALQFKAERDPLTGLYNKEMTQKLIEAQLTPDRQGALLIIDVDNFKSVNDTFGHAYGDVVICDVAKKITKTFRDNDIVGRIGGDEFLVYMKNTSNLEVMTIKATQLCEAIRTTYSSNIEETVTVSSSIGISLYSADGNSFQELYKSADAALYESKSQGKNTFTFCHEELAVDFESSQMSTIESNFNGQNNFVENAPEHIFKILYSSENYLQSVHTVIEFITKYYNFDRGYIYTINDNNNENHYDYEWKKDDTIPAFIPCVKGKNREIIKKIFSNIESATMHIYKNLDNAPSLMKEYLDELKIVSTVRLPIFFEDEVAGMIGFDTCTNEINFPKEELHKLATICTILSTFFQIHYAKDRERKSLDALTNAMDELNCYVYAVDKASYKVLYMNSKTTRLLAQDAQSVGLCYESFFGYSSPCKTCPLMHLSPTNHSSVSYVHNRNINSWCEIKGTSIMWENGKEVGLLSAIDTDKYSPFFEDHSSTPRLE